MTLEFCIFDFNYFFLMVYMWCVLFMSFIFLFVPSFIFVCSYSYVDSSSFECGYEILTFRSKKISFSTWLSMVLFFIFSLEISLLLLLFITLDLIYLSLYSFACFVIISELSSFFSKCWWVTFLNYSGLF